MLQATRAPAVELPHPHQKQYSQTDEKQRRIGQTLKKFYKYFDDDLCFLCFVFGLFVLQFNQFAVDVCLICLPFFVRCRVGRYMVKAPEPTCLCYCGGRVCNIYEK